METTLRVQGMNSQEDADRVVFELQDLPCIGVVDVDLAQQTVWIDHTNMISVDELQAAVAEAGFPSAPV
jgi:copper chaperone CopZ